MTKILYPDDIVSFRSSTGQQPAVRKALPSMAKEPISKSFLDFIRNTNLF
jgi:hypothetical protein